MCCVTGFRVSKTNSLKKSQATECAHPTPATFTVVLGPKMGICTVHPRVCEPRPNLNQALLKPLSGRPWGAPELGESSCSPVDRALGGSCEAGPSLEPRSKSPIKSRHRSAQLGCLPKCPKTGRRSTQPAVAPATWHFRPPSARERERERSVGSARGARSLERGPPGLGFRASFGPDAGSERSTSWPRASRASRASRVTQGLGLS